LARIAILLQTEIHTASKFWGNLFQYCDRQITKDTALFLGNNLDKNSLINISHKASKLKILAVISPAPIANGVDLEVVVRS